MTFNPTRQRSVPVPLPEQPALSESPLGLDTPSSAPASQDAEDPVRTENQAIWAWHRSWGSAPSWPEQDSIEEFNFRWSVDKVPSC
jgi:hypothetical protein